MPAINNKPDAFYIKITIAGYQYEILLPVIMLTNTLFEFQSTENKLNINLL